MLDYFRYSNKNFIIFFEFYNILYQGYFQKFLQRFFRKLFQGIFRNPKRYLNISVWISSVYFPRNLIQSYPWIFSKSFLGMHLENVLAICYKDSFGKPSGILSENLLGIHMHSEINLGFFLKIFHGLPKTFL